MIMLDRLTVLAATYREANKITPNAALLGHLEQRALRASILQATNHDHDPGSGTLTIPPGLRIIPVNLPTFLSIARI